MPLPPPATHTPPHPSLYGANVNQDLIKGIMKGMTSRRNMVDGKPTSLLDLGYITVGLDECVFSLFARSSVPGAGSSVGGFSASARRIHAPLG